MSFERDTCTCSRPSCLLLSLAPSLPLVASMRVLDCPCKFFFGGGGLAQRCWPWMRSMGSVLRLRDRWVLGVSTPAHPALSPSSLRRCGGDPREQHTAFIKVGSVFAAGYVLDILRPPPVPLPLLHLPLFLLVDRSLSLCMHVPAVPPLCPSARTYVHTTTTWINIFLISFPLQTHPTYPTPSRRACERASRRPGGGQRGAVVNN